MWGRGTWPVHTRSLQWAEWQRFIPLTAGGGGGDDGGGGGDGGGGLCATRPRLTALGAMSGRPGTTSRMVRSKNGIDYKWCYCCCHSEEMLLVFYGILVFFPFVKSKNGIGKMYMNI